MDVHENTRNGLQMAFNTISGGWTLNERGEPVSGATSAPVVSDEDFASRRIRDLTDLLLVETTVKKRLQHTLREVRDSVELHYYDKSVKKKFVLSEIIKILDEA